MDAVRCFVGRNQSSWDILLPQIAGALRASVNRHTGFTRNKLMLGKEVYMPADLIFPLPGQTGIEQGEHVEKLQTCMQEAHHVARKVLKQNVKRMKRF